MRIVRLLFMAEISSNRGLSEACHLRVSDGCLDFREHAELREDHRSRGIAVERLDLAVYETEDVTARRVHPLSRWRKDPHRRRQGPLVCTLKGELHDDDIADAEQPVQLAMHVGKRPVGLEALNPTLDVYLFGHFVRSANDLLVVHGKVPSAQSVENSTSA